MPLIHGFYNAFYKSLIWSLTEYCLIGIVIDIREVTLKWRNEKKLRIKKFEEDLLEVITLLRDVEKFLGSLLAAFRDASYGRLFYRCLEMDKIKALKCSSGNFDTICTICHKDTKEITWWRDDMKLKGVCNKQLPCITYCT